MKELRRLRGLIDEIDSRLVSLLNERARLAQEVGRVKEDNGCPVYAPERAEELLRRLSLQSDGPLGEQEIRAIYTEIMSAALSLEKAMVVACAGEPGGAAHFAARQQFGSSIRFSFYPDAPGVVKALGEGHADCGVVPEGGEPLDTLLAERGLSILLKSEIDHGPKTAFLVLGRRQHPV